jgi:hypothetical protein
METLVEYELQLMDTKEIVNRGNFVEFRLLITALPMNFAVLT